MPATTKASITSSSGSVPHCAKTASFICFTCQHHFNSSPLLERHLRFRHCLRPKSEKVEAGLVGYCFWCSKAFTKLSLLEEHFKVCRQRSVNGVSCGESGGGKMIAELSQISPSSCPVLENASSPFHPPCSVIDTLSSDGNPAERKEGGPPRIDLIGCHALDLGFSDAESNSSDVALPLDELASSNDDERLELGECVGLPDVEAMSKANSQALGTESSVLTVEDSSALGGFGAEIIDNTAVENTELEQDSTDLRMDCGPAQVIQFSETDLRNPGNSGLVIDSSCSAEASIEQDQTGERVTTETVPVIVGSCGSDNLPVLGGLTAVDVSGPANQSTDALELANHSTDGKESLRVDTAEPDNDVQGVSALAFLHSDSSPSPASVQPPDGDRRVVVAPEVASSPSVSTAVSVLDIDPSTGACRGCARGTNHCGIHRDVMASLNAFNAEAVLSDLSPLGGSSYDLQNSSFMHEAPRAEGGYKCSQCDRWMATSNGLKRHLQLHHKLTDLPCSY